MLNLSVFDFLSPGPSIAELGALDEKAREEYLRNERSISEDISRIRIEW